MSKKIGRPSAFSEEVTSYILNHLIEGRSLRSICGDDGMPTPGTVFRWLADHKEFRQRYSIAREMQADLMDDKILELAENCTAETASADRVRLTAYQWRASKLAPKKYGDKVGLEHSASESLADLVMASYKSTSE